MGAVCGGPGWRVLVQALPLLCLLQPLPGGTWNEGLVPVTPLHTLVRRAGPRGPGGSAVHAPCPGPRVSEVRGGGHPGPVCAPRPRGLCRTGRPCPSSHLASPESARDPTVAPAAPQGASRVGDPLVTLRVCVHPRGEASPASGRGSHPPDTPQPGTPKELHTNPVPFTSPAKVSHPPGALTFGEEAQVLENPPPLASWDQDIVKATSRAPLSAASRRSQAASDPGDHADRSAGAPRPGWALWCVADPVNVLMRSS
ncbi:unnamed protein product [Nyctereutes procyonoides]|uniref:(raccoon dog) hypothetical protein n=1 Tax=Nyctereutes procyonoides TaxID=34880 RepID=A0A811YVP7_NYCPR|nr:unnamed protein product [Nyctereutes procyonoides]